MQTGTLRRSVARASKGLMVAASVLVAATASAQMRPLEKFIRVGIGPAPGNGNVCGLTDTNLLRCWGGGSNGYPLVVDELETQAGAYSFRSFWMGPSGVCSVMDNVADGTSRTGCSAVVYSATASAATWADFGQTTVLRSSSAAWASPVLAGARLRLVLSIPARFTAPARPRARLAKSPAQAKTGLAYRLAYPPLAAPCLVAASLPG